jgi:hypothetical protein
MPEDQGFSFPGQGAILGHRVDLTLFHVFTVCCVHTDHHGKQCLCIRHGVYVRVFVCQISDAQ